MAFMHSTEDRVYPRAVPAFKVGGKRAEQEKARIFNTSFAERFIGVKKGTAVLRFDVCIRKVVIEEAEEGI